MVNTMGPWGPGGSGWKMVFLPKRLVGRSVRKPIRRFLWEIWIRPMRGNIDAWLCELTCTYPERLWGAWVHLWNLPSFLTKVERHEIPCIQAVPLLVLWLQRWSGWVRWQPEITMIMICKRLRLTRPQMTSPGGQITVTSQTQHLSHSTRIFGATAGTGSTVFAPGHAASSLVDWDGRGLSSQWARYPFAGAGAQIVPWSEASSHPTDCWRIGHLEVDDLNSNGARLNLRACPPCLARGQPT